MEEKKGQVEFRDVSFRYPGAEEPVLHHLNFTAQPGKTTAFIGSTGSGKSTLINLVPRFFDASEGEVLVDGVNVRDVSQHEPHERIGGYVPQKGYLFSGTIASNLRYAKEDADMEEMRKASEIAQAVEFIDAKPEGFLYTDRTGRNQCFRRTAAASVDRPRTGEDTGDLHL